MNVNEKMTADNRNADDCDLNADADYATCCWDMSLCYRWIDFGLLGNVFFPLYQFLNAITVMLQNPLVLLLIALQ